MPSRRRFLAGLGALVAVLPFAKVQAAVPPSEGVSLTRAEFEDAKKLLQPGNALQNMEERKVLQEQLLGSAWYQNYLKSGFPKAILNVRDFGAVGDGVTDDSVAFSNAVREASIRSVYDVPTAIRTPSGSYNLRQQGSIEVPEGHDRFVPSPMITESTTVQPDGSLLHQPHIGLGYFAPSRLLDEEWDGEGNT